MIASKKIFAASYQEYDSNPVPDFTKALSAFGEVFYEGEAKKFIEY